MAINKYFIFLVKEKTNHFPCWNEMKLKNTPKKNSLGLFQVTTFTWFS